MLNSWYEYDCSIRDGVVWIIKFHPYTFECVEQYVIGNVAMPDATWFDIFVR